MQGLLYGVRQGVQGAEEGGLMVRYRVCEICEDVREVKYPSQQKTERCRRCAARASNKLTTEARKRGAERSKQIRRERQMARLSQYTPIQIFRMAYTQGWKAGMRCQQRKSAA